MRVPTLAVILAVPIAAHAASPRFAYGTPAFDLFVQDSCHVCGGPLASGFYAWMDEHAKAKGYLAWESRLDDWGSRWPRLTQSQRLDVLANLHRSLKKTIGKFSLDRGFEFANVMRTGERQCLLQSIVIAGMAHRMGVEAGLAMVNRNMTGQYSNNGHVVPLVRLARDRWMLVDASEPTLFSPHQGLMVYLPTSKTYLYVAPNYSKDGTISGFQAQKDALKVAADQIEGLPLAYIRSQVDYYRGERATDGLLAKAPTPSGLQLSRKWLRSSVAKAPGNPLAQAMLARVERMLGDTKAAEASRARAAMLYRRYGWTPDSY